MKIKLLFLTLLTLLTLSSNINKPKVIEGNLYFQAMDFFRFFDLPDSEISALELRIQNIDFDTLSNSEKKDFDIWFYAIENNLLRTPYIRLRDNKGKPIMLYMNQSEYNLFEQLKCNELRRDSIQIHVTAEVENISFRKIKAYKLIGSLKTTEIHGITGCGK